MKHSNTSILLILIMIFGLNLSSANANTLSSDLTDDTSKQVSVRGSGDLAKMIKQVRNAYIVPRNIITVNAGYGSITSSLYDLDGQRVDDNVGGLNLMLQYEYVFRQGMTLGMHINYFESNQLNGDISQISIAPQVGYCQYLGRNWLLKADFNVGYSHFDQSGRKENGICVGLNIGTEYMVTRFLGLGVSVGTENTFLLNAHKNSYSEKLTNINRFMASGGVRFYF